MESFWASLSYRTEDSARRREWERVREAQECQVRPFPIWFHSQKHCSTCSAVRSLHRNHWSVIALFALNNWKTITKIWNIPSNPRLLGSRKKTNGFILRDCFSFAAQWSERCCIVRIGIGKENNKPLCQIPIYHSRARENVIWALQNLFTTFFTTITVIATLPTKHLLSLSLCIPRSLLRLQNIILHLRFMLPILWPVLHIS